VTSSRLPEGGSWIDRSKPISFRFDGVEYEGFEGDTLASALLANGIVGGFRSPILGRPRGIMTAGPEEPNAFVEVSEPWFEPIVAATTVELVDGLVAEPRAGVGRLPSEPNGSRVRRVEHRHVHVELLVIGSGHDGLYRAEESRDRDERVLLVERRPELITGSGATWRPEGVTYLPRATALGLYDDGYAIVHERGPEVDRLWHVRAGRVVLATGGHERSIVFADDDRPGIMFSTAVGSYLRAGVLPGTRCVIFTARSPAYNAARSLREAGAEVPVIVDARSDADTAAFADGIEVLAGSVVVGVDGDTRIRGVHLVGLEGEKRSVECDALFVSGGWNPDLSLWRSIGGGVRYDDATACFVPNGDGPPWLSVVGAGAGDVFNDTAYWCVPADDYSRHFVDFQRDQTIADIQAAVDAGLTSVEHVKRATYIGTAIDQGRTSGVLTAAIVTELLGAGPGAQGPTSARPPVVPVSYATIAGHDRGDLLDPIRTTRIHPWHEERGAVYEDVGQWKRPRYFPRDGEDMDAAVARECLATRNTAGILDASTLGKIEVVGPDAATFLDRMYTNRMSTLAVGSIRYGFMLGLEGMVVDDGVAMRLADDRFFVTTTTGNAAMILDRFEEWLQTEWPALEVYCTSVTEQWSDAAIAGPKARDVLTALGTDLDLSPDAFPFMTFRDGTVGGIPARVARVSFTGELSYEVMVDARRGLELWEAAIAAGGPHGITPYGTEAMHLLRAEKGFVIVGQDTDGTVTPHDLGMGWIVRKDDSDFLGRRSLRRADTVRADRKQLVGLLPESILPEGAQLVEEDTGRIPMPMIGHVTSSYVSAALGRPIALAMVERGRERHGQTVFAPLPQGTISAEIVEPTFYDPEGLRRDG
jgi:sarcosine oxidase subunit alpha